MSKYEIPELAKKHLNDLLNESGSILYSSHETLKPGQIYLLGFNPGGAGGNSLLSSIDRLLNNESNSYLDECWENLSGSWEAGDAPLQKRVCYLLENLGLNPREVCSSNLIFLQSREAKNINFNLANRCWPIHESILQLIKPKLIIAFGNSGVSPYGYLHNMLGGEQEYIPSGHGNWNVKGFTTQINENPVYIAGLPHLSRYSPIGKDNVLNWLSSKL